MILIGIGSNLPSEEFGSPLATCEAALAALSALKDEAGQPILKILARSRWFESAPVPLSDQPWFINAVVSIETLLRPQSLLSCLHDIEAKFGRTRRTRNEARILDMDLLAYGDVVSGQEGQEGEGEEKEGNMVLPHPRIGVRAFVLLPLADIAPDWRHPSSGEPLERLIAALDADQVIRPVELAP